MSSTVNIEQIQQQDDYKMKIILNDDHLNARDKQTLKKIVATSLLLKGLSFEDIQAYFRSSIFKEGFSNTSLTKLNNEIALFSQEEKDKINSNALIIFNKFGKTNTNVNVNPDIETIEKLENKISQLQLEKSSQELEITKLLHLFLDIKKTFDSKLPYTRTQYKEKIQKLNLNFDLLLQFKEKAEEL
jgi:hypothetical protein